MADEFYEGAIGIDLGEFSCLVVSNATTVINVSNADLLN
jgi:hypothetical protein